MVVFPEVDQEMRVLASEVEGVREIEKCRVRKSGIGIFLDLHVWVDAETTVREGHRIGHEVKDHMKKTKPQVVDIVVHLEPFERAALDTPL